MRRLAAIACAGAACAAALAADPGSACVSTDVDAADVSGFARDAVAVLREAGYDPADYRLEIRRDDPLTGLAAAVGSRPAVSAVFLPADRERLHVVRVNGAHPCGLSWVWQPSEFTAWQRGVVEVARRAAAESHPGWTGDGPLAVSVLETRSHVGVRVAPARPAAEAGAEPARFQLLIDKQELEPIRSAP